MVTNNFGNKKSFMQPMKGSGWTHKGSKFFFFFPFLEGRKGGRSFFFFFLLFFPLFPSSFLCVPMRFPKGSPKFP